MKIIHKMNNTGIQSNNDVGRDSLDLSKSPRYKKPNSFGHDSSICIIKEGKPIYANAEERFTMKKHEGSSIKNTLLDVRNNLDEDLINTLEEWQESGPRNGIDHHLSHIYEVFYNSGFDDAAIFVNDGCGTANDCMTLAYMKRGEEPLILKKFSDKNSLGNLYSIVSHCIFNKQEFTEGKLMGLASYGTPIKNLSLVDVVDGEIAWNYKAFKAIGIELAEDGGLLEFAKNSLCDYPLLIQANYAATLQRDFENCSIKVINLLASLLKKHKIATENLCLSGGCILNCPTNSKIIELGLFKHYYASPNPADGGVCFGNLYESLIREDVKNAFQYLRLSSPYLGYSYSYDELKRDLKQSDYYDFYKNWIIDLDESVYHTLCNYLFEQKILCWYQGGAEFGPRALGHRSLLADPRSFEMNQKLNFLKGRELWRPLAPIVPEELFCDVFEVENTDLCEFMLRTLKIREKWIPMLQGVCHVDGTARPQLLRKKLNPELYNLLLLWYRKTGCPALINTSLNLAGLPIVERSSQVLDLMYTSAAPELVGVFIGRNSSEIAAVPNKNFKNTSY